MLPFYLSVAQLSITKLTVAFCLGPGGPRCSMKVGFRSLSYTHSESFMHSPAMSCPDPVPDSNECQC